MGKRIIWWWRFFPWRYDKLNPYRKYCRECCTQQNLYEMFGVRTWEFISPIYYGCSHNHENSRLTKDFKVLNRKRGVKA